MYTELRRILKERKLHGQDLGDAIGLSQSEISTRMCGVVQWRLDEIYAAMDWLGLDESALPIVFPREGKGDRRIDDEVVRVDLQLQMIDLGRALLERASRLGHERQKE